MEHVRSSGRREFLKVAAAGSAVAAVGQVAFGGLEMKGSNDFIPLGRLPYEPSALAPNISARTVDYHYNRHHAKYHKKLVDYIASNLQYKNMPLEDVIRKALGGIGITESIFQVSVLLWNHNFYWQGMKPQGGGAPERKLKVGKALGDAFGSYDKFRAAFIEESLKLGIGWVWLVGTPDGLKITRTDYHDSPLVHDQKPLFTVDVWEHAYYLDYQNDRQKYVENILDHLVNWDFAESTFLG